MSSGRRRPDPLAPPIPRANITSPYLTSLLSTMSRLRPMIAVELPDVKSVWNEMERRFTGGLRFRFHMQMAAPMHRRNRKKLAQLAEAHDRKPDYRQGHDTGATTLTAGLPLLLVRRYAMRHAPSCVTLPYCHRQASQGCRFKSGRGVERRRFHGCWRRP